MTQFIAFVRAAGLFDKSMTLSDFDRLYLTATRPARNGPGAAKLELRARLKAHMAGAGVGGVAGVAAAALELCQR